MAGAPELQVAELGAQATYDLRRRVLRHGRAGAEARFPEDDEAAAFHLGALDRHGRLWGIATVSPAATPVRPGRVAWRVRGMAVEPEHQGAGVGTLLVEALVGRARAAGVEVVWADGRDSALAFYRHRGWVVEGEGYLRAGDIPHHTVVLDL